MIIALAARNIWSALPWIVLRYRPVNEPGPRARHVDDHVTSGKFARVSILSQIGPTPLI